jgi:ubiquinone/menaquinone biosynthesis C-methylase UbiE
VAAVFNEVAGDHAGRLRDRGLSLLTLGRDARVKAHLAEMMCQGDAVLEIGCGTGTLALMLARRDTIELR